MKLFANMWCMKAAAAPFRKVSESSSIRPEKHCVVLCFVQLLTHNLGVSMFRSLILQASPACPRHGDATKRTLTETFSHQSFNITGAAEYRGWRALL